MKTLSLIFGSIISSFFAFSQATVSYSADDSNFPNPERGFYHHTEASSSNYTQLDAGSLSAYRSNGITLILRVFYLSDFKESTISDEYLNNMNLDFQIARQAGVKVIVRFAYTKKSSKPYGDASLENNLVHLEQLKPILHANEDVISFVQAGFIGTWGEWYYTDHYSAQVGFPNEEDWIKRRQLVKGILEAVPASIMVQLRTPDIKFNILDDEIALTSTEAFTQTDKARLGHHNDCFLASSNDVGTYKDIEKEKAYLEEETKYLVMGGETCGVAAPYSECPNATSELGRFHYTYLNTDYHPQVLNSWEDDGCFNEVERRLGYRFRMISSTITDTSKPLGQFNLSLDLSNDGWAVAFSNREVQIILKNQDSKDEYIYKTSEDLRFWSLDSDTTIELAVGLPNNIKLGNYSVYLNIPDKNISLANDPNYSIRMANTNAWEQTSGYNDLGVTLNIDANNVAPDYDGEDFFSKRVSLESVEDAIIEIDGELLDWSNLPTLVFATSNLILKTLQVHNNSDSLFIGISGTNIYSAYQIFIDADNSSTTGYNAWQWSANGADFLIENGILYSYSGIDHAWGWQQVRAITAVITTSVIELSLPLADLGESQHITLAVVNDQNGDIETNYIPYQNEAFIGYDLFISVGTELLAGRDTDRILLFWGKDDPSVTRIIERAVDEGEFELIATLEGDVEYYYDFTVEVDKTYHYRYFKITNSSKSTYSNSVSELVTVEDRRFYEIICDGQSDDWFAIPPLASQIMHSTYTVRTFWGTQNINFLITGEAVSEYHSYLDTDNNTATGGGSSFDSTTGYEFLISNGELYEFKDGEWQKIETTIAEGMSSGILEYSVAISSLNGLGNNNDVGIAVYLGTPSGIIGLQGLNGATIYKRSFGSSPTSSFAVKKSGDFPKERLVITWDICEDCDGSVLERSLDGIDFNEITDFGSTSKTYFDNGLDDETTYFYRMFTYNEIGPSEYSDIVNESTGAVLTGLEEPQFQKVSVFPNPASDIIKISIDEYAERIKIQVFSIDGYEVLNLDKRAYQGRSSVKIDNLKEGTYIIIVTSNKMRYYNKFIRH